jgi:predicted RNA binding protein YcfA (HicA-like mRNA interferase family)
VARVGPFSGAEVVAALRRLGFERIGQRGSHVKMRHSDGRVAIVPMHDELARGTFASILRQAHVTAEDLSR